ncbi:MAG: hypothetical protein AAFU71_10020 [Cyanobacteria bacterium J06632_22]
MIEVQANRAVSLFQQAATVLNQSIPIGNYPIFSYWCRFYGQNPSEREDSIKLIEPEAYNPLESKRRVSETLTAHGIDDVFPATFTRVVDAIAHPHPPSIWFVKPNHLSGGRGIQVVAHKDLANLELPRHSLIQAGVEDIKLIDGRKFTARVYVLLWHGNAYLFDDGFVVIHAPQYQRGSTEYGVQVDHRGYQTGNSGVEMKLYSGLPRFAETMTQVKASLRRIFPALQSALKATTEKRYLLLGIDLLPLETGGIRLIEINAIPNFVHSQTINQGLNVFFFEHVMRLIYGFGSDRLMRIKEAAASRVFVMRRFS